MASTSLLPYLLRMSMATSRLHSFRFLHHYSTAALQPQPQPLSVLQNYLINSIGLTPESASSATKHLRLFKSFNNDPDLVVNYLKRFGLDNDHIKSLVSSYPEVLTYNVSKTLEPKIRVLQDIGFTESDIGKIVRVYKSLFIRGVEPLVERIQFLKDLLGSHENVAKAVSKCVLLLFEQSQKNIDSGISVLREIGFSDRHIAHFLMHCPLVIMRANTQWFQDVLHRVEHDLGIPRDSGKFFYAVKFVSNLSKSSLEDKLGVFRRFGWSDATIRKMVGNFPTVLGTSEDKLTKCLDFFMGELGCSPEVLALYPVAFCLSLDKVKLRNDVLKVLEEKKLNQRKKSHFAVLVSTDQTFLKNYLLPHQNEIPTLYGSYIERFDPVMKEMKEKILDLQKTRNKRKTRGRHRRQEAAGNGKR